MNFKFGKLEKLKSKKTIDCLFKEGQSVTVFPLRMIYLKIDGEAPKTQIGVSVSKRLHKTAVTRNRIKRLLREAIRLNKPIYFNNSTTSYALMILYISKEGTSFEVLNTAMKSLLEKFVRKTAKNETKTP